MNNIDQKPVYGSVVDSSDHFIEFNRSALDIYLSEIGKMKLLTLEEEIDLFKKIKAGNKMARVRMIEANLRLVVKIAYDFENKGLPLLDLISEGNIGLMKAVDRFNPSKGAKLSTYASHWIKHYMRRSIMFNGRTIRLPIHICQSVGKMFKTIKQFEYVLKYELSDEKIASQLGISVSKVAFLKRVAQKQTSLSTPIDKEDSESKLSDLIEDKNVVSPATVISQAEQSVLVEKMLAQLDRKKRLVIEYRFGLNGRKRKTNDAIGKQFGVTRERIRQIEALALGKLRFAHNKLIAQRLS